MPGDYVDDSSNSGSGDDSLDNDTDTDDGDGEGVGMITETGQRNKPGSPHKQKHGTDISWKLKRVKHRVCYIIKFITAFPIAWSPDFSRDLWLWYTEENECQRPWLQQPQNIWENTGQWGCSVRHQWKSRIMPRVKSGTCDPVLWKLPLLDLLSQHQISAPPKMGKPNAAICYAGGFGILRNKQAFLQHGIITADLSFCIPIQK